MKRAAGGGLRITAKLAPPVRSLPLASALPEAGEGSLLHRRACLAEARSAKAGIGSDSLAFVEIIRESNSYPRALFLDS